MNIRAPLPLERHPFYDDKTWLIGLLAEGGAAVEYVQAGNLLEPGDVERLLITKQRVVALAPYVGDPFYYEWIVGTDNYGRQIATDSRIVHYPPNPIYE